MRVVYLANYTPNAMKGVIGGSDRTAAIQTLMNTVGGKLVSFMFARGEYDAVVTVDLPDRNAAVAGVMAVLASGGVSKLTMLEELDMSEILPMAQKAARAFQPAG